MSKASFRGQGHGALYARKVLWCFKYIKLNTNKSHLSRIYKLLLLWAYTYTNEIMIEQDIKRLVKKREAWCVVSMEGWYGVVSREGM